ncbi:MAG: FAD binding domain-containing protein [Caldilineaceae bacterium]|nr:FAD binding domain-containing protein [Caldilineaceae bacterium]
MTYWQHYHTPTTVTDALSLLRQYGDDAKLIAGGTDLIIDMQNGAHAPVTALVDVTQIDGLATIHTETDEGADGDAAWVVLGAAVTHTQIERSPIIQEHGAALVESCSVVGGPQVRNVATIGGNVAHALPAADGTIGLLALDAQVQVCTLTGGTGSGGNGSPASEGSLTSTWQPLLSIFSGPGRNNLGGNQLLSAFRFRQRQPRQGSAFDRIMRPQGIALPMLGLAANVTLDESLNRISAATIAIGPAGPIPFRAASAEALLTSAPFSDDLLTEAIIAAQQQAQLRTSRHRASREYRHEMIAVLMRRVLIRALARARLEA